jgi:hypothetical protein
LGKYSDSISGAAAFYASSGYDDDLALAATWLHLATTFSSGATTSTYLTYAESKYASAGLGDKIWATGWDDVSQVVSVLLWKITGNPTYATKLETFVNQWLPGGAIPKTPKGLAFRDTWGSLRYATTTSLLAFIYADSIYTTKATLSQSYHDFAVAQVHYALGDAGRSFMVGFGTNYPKQPHHRGASCPVTGSCGFNYLSANTDNPQVIYGALVGGPSSDDSYSDVRNNYQNNEVTTDYNAGFQGALARLYMEVAATPGGTTAGSAAATTAGSGSATTTTSTGASPAAGQATTTGAVGEGTGGLKSAADSTMQQPMQLALAAVTAIVVATGLLSQ